jgi:hypothetical protein
MVHAVRVLCAGAVVLCQEHSDIFLHQQRSQYFQFTF